MTEEKIRVDRQIEVIPIAKPPVQYVIWNEEGTELAGYCLITVDIKETGIIDKKHVKEAAIWHIHTEDKYLRKGYAKCLIGALQASFDRVYTQAMTPEGKKLLMSCGFVREDKGGLKIFRWRAMTPRE